MTPLNPDLLDISPVQPPRITRVVPAGVEVKFSEIVAKAGMRKVTSGVSSVRILITNEQCDTRTPSPGSVIYGISACGWDPETKEFAREVIRRLAYGFHDWAARETASRYHRDLKRETARPIRKNVGSIKDAVDLIQAIVNTEKEYNAETISKKTGISQSNVLRGLSVLEKRGHIQLIDKGKSVWRKRQNG